MGIEFFPSVFILKYDTVHFRETFNDRISVVYIIYIIYIIYILLVTYILRIYDYYMRIRRMMKDMRGEYNRRRVGSWRPLLCEAYLD